MIKLHVEGSIEDVKPFLSDISRTSTIEEIESKETESQITANCYVTNDPAKQMQTVVVETKSGAVVKIPLAYLVKADLLNGIKMWSGKTFDLFSVKLLDPKRCEDMTQSLLIQFRYNSNDKAIDIYHIMNNETKRLTEEQDIKQFLDVYQVTLDELKDIHCDIDRMKLFENDAAKEFKRKWFGK